MRISALTLVCILAGACAHSNSSTALSPTNCHLTERDYWKGGRVRDPKAINWDAEREKCGYKIRWLVIHHTEDKGDRCLSWEAFSYIGLVRLYAPRYESKEPEPNVFGLPIHSGHTQPGGEWEVFSTYHHSVCMDGTAEHLLDDNAVAWHAGNWDINLQSLGLVFQCDCDKHAPVPEAMEIMARIVAEYMIKYDIPPDHVIGHRDVHKKNGQLIQKSCPGNWWVEKGGDDLTGHERFMRRAVEIRDEMVRSKK